MLGCRGRRFEIRCETEEGVGDAVGLDSILAGRTPFSFLVEGGSSRIVGAAIEDLLGRKEVRGRRLLLANDVFEISMTLDLRPANEPGPSRLRGL